MENLNSQESNTLDVSDIYTITTYEVIDESTHKYTSTSVSGGSGSITTNGNVVSGSVSPVKSTTHFHSDQGLWVKDIETGKEHKFDFRTFNIDVRPGHRILIAFNTENKKIERIVNLSTDVTYSAEGVFNLDSRKSAGLATPKARRFNAIAFGLMISIPYLGMLLTPILLVFMLLGLSFNTSAKTPKRKTAIVSSVSLIFLHNYIMLSGALNGSGFGWVVYFAVAFTAFYTVLSKSSFREFVAIKSHSDSLDGLVKRYISSNAEKLAA